MRKAAADRVSKPLSENKAALQMWSFYKANKPNLSSRIRVHREPILSALMQGATPHAAFAPYLRPAVAAPVLPTPL